MLIFQINFWCQPSSLRVILTPVNAARLSEWECLCLNFRPHLIACRGVVVPGGGGAGSGSTAACSRDNTNASDGGEK